MTKRSAWLLMLPTLAAVAGCSRGPTSVAKDFTRALADGDTGGALDRFDPEIKQMGGMKLVAGLGRAAATIKAKGGLKDLEVLSDSTSGDHGTVSLKETFGDGSTSTDTEKLRKVDGKWYVTM